MRKDLNCGDCGEKMIHNRMEGCLELDFVELILQCQNCGNYKKIRVNPIEEEEKAERWDEAIKRMTYGKAKPEDSTVDKKAEIELKKVNPDAADHKNQKSLTELSQQ